MSCPHELQGYVAPWVVRVQLGIAACALCSCGGTVAITAPDSALVAVEAAQQKACVDGYPGDASAQNACRAQTRAWWDQYWGGRFDGGGQ